ncbi:MAG TPA: anhydro-N-acetylmuramic acid kinase [Bacilli bacterium]|nr:MAG: Anhydro-N-acetylmuramic acid kinase [Tenericutes bacterium ADurb.BinA124]HNZ50713.1 anhydro-N-acetylmuramic acid kinase [Bacilli bacterium]HPX84915.1 anhydro-N-acetylmuramic acid kinase [Bacilli bacterium]HQC74848.1 anhydro-N-acetylmuramic acid kinase [Bacilli bacterium]
MRAIGLMSGTSLDGCDAALVKINEGHFYLEKFVTLPYDELFKAKIMRNLSNETAKLAEICSLNFELGERFVEAIDLLLAGTGLNYADIAFVASHGQTIWHNPKPSDLLVPSTLQIGEASVITYRTNITTVFNFRTMDIAAGGEGAPLVPMADFMLFKSDTEAIILQNIGGIANLSYLPKGASIDEVVAFDCGPGNVMIDYFMNKYYQRPYDDGGKVALSGMVIIPIYEALIKDPFFSKKPPKSTGRELYNAQAMENMAEQYGFSHYAKEDIITTVSEVTVYGITHNIALYTPNFDRIVVSGGGSHNHYLLSHLQDILNKPVLTQEDLGFSSDAKEAVAFAVLGYLTLNNQPGNVISATGAKRPVVLGNIAPRKE